MKSIGFLISHKNGEKRRAILPEDLFNFKYPEKLFFENNYGEVFGISDDEYKKYGVNFLDRKEIFSCDVLVDVKIGDSDYLHKVNKNKILFGWAHAAQKKDFTKLAIKNNHTVIAWEEMDEDGRNIFYRNREIAGEAGIYQAFLHLGKMPYDSKVAILGRGNTAKGALRVLNGLGAEVDVYGRYQEKLFVKSIDKYDVLVNCTMWDLKRTDRILSRDDLKRMKKGSMIVDISCDNDLSIETCHSTTIEDPVYTEEGILHYVVDNTPSIFYFTSSKVISQKLPKYLIQILENNYSKILQNAKVIDNKCILFDEILDFHKAN